MDCSSCHNPHEGQVPNMLKADVVNELCYQCHAEKRGPFLFEHAAVKRGLRLVPRSPRHEPGAPAQAEGAESLLELPPHRVGPLRIRRQLQHGEGRARGTAGRAKRVSDRQLPLHRAELPELPRQAPRLQPSLRRLLREVSHEANHTRPCAVRLWLARREPPRCRPTAGTGASHPLRRLRRTGSRVRRPCCCSGATTSRRRSSRSTARFRKACRCRCSRSWAARTARTSPCSANTSRGPTSATPAGRACPGSGSRSTTTRFPTTWGTTAARSTPKRPRACGA